MQSGAADLGHTLFHLKRLVAWKSFTHPPPSNMHSYVLLTTKRFLEKQYSEFF